jgi:DNA repair protein RecO (recombination protein O)
MIVRTEAIVLRSVNYGETSQIVTLYTKALGTVAVMAKGARGPRSKFGSALQPMAHAQVVFYHKNSRDVHTLSEASHTTLFRKLYRELDRMEVGVRVIEVVRVLMSRPEPDSVTFDMLLDVLTRLENSNRHWTNLLPYCQLRLSASLGFAPIVDRDDVLNIGQAGGYVSLEDGNITESKPTQPSTPVSRKAIRAVGVMMHADLDTVMRMNLDPAVLNEVVELVETYLRYHVEDFWPSRSKLVFDRML